MSSELKMLVDRCDALNGLREEMGWDRYVVRTLSNGYGLAYAYDIGRIAQGFSTFQEAYVALEKQLRTISYRVEGVHQTLDILADLASAERDYVLVLWPNWSGTFAELVESAKAMEGLQ